MRNKKPKHWVKTSGKRWRLVTKKTARRDIKKWTRQFYRKQNYKSPEFQADFNEWWNESMPRKKWFFGLF